MKTQVSEIDGVAASVEKNNVGCINRNMYIHTIRVNGCFESEYI